MGRSRDLGEQIVSCTKFASVHDPRIYAVSVGLLFAIRDPSSIRSSTDTSVWVAEGGSDRRTVRNVSCSKTACHNLRRCCFSNILALGVTTYDLPVSGNFDLLRSLCLHGWECSLSMG
jgi:hypothetical protein